MNYYQVIPVLRQVASTLGRSVRANVGVNGAVGVTGALLASCGVWWRCLC